MKKTAIGSLVVGSVVAGMLLGSAPVNGATTTVGYTVAGPDPEPETTYTLVIPASVTLDSTKDTNLYMNASNVNLAQGKKVTVSLSAENGIENSKLTLTKGNDSFTVGIKNSAEEQVAQNDVVTEIKSNISGTEGIGMLKIAAPTEDNPNPGLYTETLTFTGAVVDVE